MDDLMHKPGKPAISAIFFLILLTESACLHTSRARSPVRSCPEPTFRNVSRERLGGSSIVVVGNQACAIDQREAVYCWKHGGPAQATAISGKYVTLRTETNEICAVSSSGDRVCWIPGENKPEAVCHPKELIGIALVDHYCWLDSQHTLSCTVYGKPEEHLGKLDGVRDVTHFPYVPCLLGVDGTVSCWRWNSWNGDDPIATHNDFMFRYKPTVVPIPNEVVQLQPGTKTCALSKNGGVYCWRESTIGAPTKIENLPPIRMLRGGNSVACAIDTDRGVWCWGSSHNGVVPKTVEHFKPQKIEEIPPAIDVAVDLFACALLEDGSAYCWGYCDESEGRAPQQCAPYRVEAPR